MALLPTAARAECLGPDCYSGLLWLLLGAVLGLIVLVWGTWRLLRSGRGWVIAAVAGAVLAVLGAVWAKGQVHQLWVRRDMESREVLRPLPVMAERTPLLFYGQRFSGRYSFGCTYAVDILRLTRGETGFYAVYMPKVASTALDGPIALADLPLEFHWVAAEAGTKGRDRPQASGPQEPDRSAYANDRFRMRVLSAQERPAAAAAIDYVILDPCATYPGVVWALRRHPALQGLPVDVEVDLALAPVARGQGQIDLQALTFDLLDLSWSNFAPGFPPGLVPPVASPNAPVGRDDILSAFCTLPGAGLNPAC